MANKKEFSYIMRCISGGYSPAFKPFYPTLTGVSLSQGQADAISEVLDLEDEDHRQWINDHVNPRVKKDV